jgi:hypothetical protein
MEDQSKAQEHGSFSRLTVYLRTHPVELKAVKLETHDDLFHDRARIPVEFRPDDKEGRIYKISVDKRENRGLEKNRSVLLEVRGLPGASGSDSPSRRVIQMGGIAKKKLGLEKDKNNPKVFAEKEYKFRIREVWWFGQFHWAWTASDSAARIAARLGLLGLILGLIGVYLGIHPLIFPPK